MKADSEEDLSFRYFPTDYRWSHGVLLALSSAPWGGAEIGEINRIGLRLRGHEGNDETWHAAWAAEARKVEDAGRDRLASGHEQSALRYLSRAANYYHVGERFLQPKTPESNAAYKRGVDCLRDAATLMTTPCLEYVEIPYEGTSLPAIFVHPTPFVAGKEPAPAMVFFDGFDVTKEIQYFKGVPDLAARGIGCLIVDGPGNGEAIRFRNLPLIHDTERYGKAAYEYLAGRAEVDPKRIGVMALSLGGYYAPRAATFEPRFACCVAWGAQWDYEATWRARFERLDRGDLPSLSVPWQHLLWVFGVTTREAAMAKLKDFKLDGVMQKLACPFLLMHGEGDEQIPMAVAQKCFDAAGSKHKTLRVFTREEGGYHHCQIDNISVGVAAMWDWIEDVLKPRSRNG